jgi:hypothetical protein
MARRTSVQHFLSFTFVVLIVLAMTAPSAVAKPRHSKPAEPLVTVVAHLALPGPPATKTLVQERGGQQYLLIEQASKDGFTIIDVTKPSQAKILKQVAWPNQASSGKLQLIKAGLVLSATAESNEKAAGSLPTESLNLLDLRDPANPQTIQGFTGVTTVLLDESRSLLYITNAEGLWILRYKQEEPPSDPYGCPADRISTDPNCSN